MWWLLEKARNMDMCFEISIVYNVLQQSMKHNQRSVTVFQSITTQYYQTYYFYSSVLIVNKVIGLFLLPGLIQITFPQQQAADKYHHFCTQCVFSSKKNKKIYTYDCKHVSYEPDIWIVGLYLGEDFYVEATCAQISCIF